MNNTRPIKPPIHADTAPLVSTGQGDTERRIYPCDAATIWTEAKWLCVGIVVATCIVILYDWLAGGGV